MKRLLPISLACCLCFVFLIPHTTHAQKLWKRYIVVYKTFYTGGGVPNYVNQIDKTKKLGVYGLFDSAHIYSTITGQLIQRTGHVYNTLEYTGTTWQSAGDAVFYQSDRSSVFFHNKLFGADYIMCTEEPYFRKRNTSTNRYEAAGNLQFSVYGGIVFNEWASKVLLLGYYTLTNNISNLCLWDMQKNTYTKVGGGTLGYDFSSPREATMSPLDSTLVFLCYKTDDSANGYRVVLYKDSTWANADYPKLPDNATHIAIADKSRMWVSTESPDASNRVSDVYALDKANMKWNKIITFKKNNLFQTPAVNSMVYGNGVVYVAGDFDSANGKVHQDLIAYAIDTKLVTAIATNSDLLNDGCGGQVYLYFEDNNLYAFANGCAIFGYADVYALTNNGVLPIQVLSFTGKQTEDGNQLVWTVPKESTVTSFSVEKSIDGRVFQPIGVVSTKQAQPGSSYSFIDSAATHQTMYYRLKLDAADGSLSYSKTIRLQATPENNIVLFPLPAQEYFTFKNAADIKQVQIINAAGQVVKQFNTPATSRFAIAELASGLYLVQVQFADRMMSLKLVKQ